MRSATRRASGVFLRASLFLVLVLAALRPLRAAGVHHAIGAILLVAIAAAVWMLGGRAIRSDEQERRQLALGGALLVAPFALVALLWIGLGTPWEATVKENQMRYLVLIAMAIAEVGGFLMVRQALRDAAERVHSTLVLAAIILAGPIYVVWDAMMFGLFIAKERGAVPPTFAALDPVLDLLLDVAAVLTYVATAALAMSLARAQWLGRRAARACVGVTIVALFFLVNRGLTYLSPAELSAPWYTVPGFVFGIPAVPYIMPFLLGVSMLRRAGEQTR